MKISESSAERDEQSASLPGNANPSRGHLHRNDCTQSLSNVISGQIVVFIFKNSVLAGIVVENACECGLKAGQVHSPFNRVDVVGETKFLRRNVIDILKRDLHVDIAFLPSCIERIAVPRFNAVSQETDV